MLILFFAFFGIYSGDLKSALMEVWALAIDPTIRNLDIVSGFQMVFDKMVAILWRMLKVPPVHPRIYTFSVINEKF